MATRQEAARNRARHSDTGRFVPKASSNGNGSRPSSSLYLTQMLRPRPTFWWTMPSIAAITPQYIEMVLRGAMAGNYVQQWELFDMMLDSWPELAACCRELLTGVLGKRIIFEPYHEEDQPPEPEALDRLTLVSTALRDMEPPPDMDGNELAGTLSDILDAWFRGISVLETVWEPKDYDNLGTIIAPSATYWVNPTEYGFNQKGQLGLRTQAPGDAYGNFSVQSPAGALVPFPDDKFLICIHKSKSGNPLGGALLRPLVWWWVASNYAADWLLNLAQLFGLPFRWATYDPNAPAETIQSISQMLQSMGNAGWAAFPAGTDLEFKESGGGRMAEYSPQGVLMDRADRYARLIVLGQTMTGNTMGGGKGGQAFGVVEKDVKTERIDAAGKFACNIINNQLIKSILKLNYGDTRMAPSVRLLEENEGQFVDAQRDQILQKMNLPFGADFMRRKYGVPEPAEGEEVLGHSQPTASVPAPQSTPDGLPQDLRQGQPGMGPGESPMASRLADLNTIKDDAEFSRELMILAEEADEKGNKP